MSKLDSIYQLAPQSLQSIMTSLYGMHLKHIRYGKYYKAQMNLLSTEKYNDIDKLRITQNQRFLELLKYAVAYSSFYKDFYEAVNLSEIETIEDLEKLPILEKEVLRKNVKDLYTIPSYKGIKSFTGGTTGKSLMVLYTKEDMQKRMAYLHTWEASHGVVQGMRRATFNGRSIVTNTNEEKVFWRYNKIRNQMLYSTFDLSEKNLGKYIESLNIFKPEVMNGFVSALYELALYINSNKIVIKFKPIVIFTTSETLLDYQRSAIEEAFQCKVRNQYASSEGAPMIAECPQGNLHYYLDMGIIEEYETECGTEMLITSFTSHGTPLIRYRIGDIWKYSNDLCPCGSVLPLVDYVEGRKVDFLYSLKGTRVSLSHLADVIKGFPNSIKNMQFIQTKKDELHIKLVVDKEMYISKDEDKIRKQIWYRFGEAMKVNLIYVETIEKEKSGKFSLIKNEVKD